MELKNSALPFGIEWFEQTDRLVFPFLVWSGVEELACFSNIDSSNLDANICVCVCVCVDVRMCSSNENQWLLRLETEKSIVS